MSEPAICIDGLCKVFRGHLGIGRTVAVDGLSLTIEAGQVFGLLGPNGAGKTTTIKMLLGLLRPDAGSVRLFGRPPEDPEARARLGFLPENPYFYDYLTAREFLDFYGRLRGMRSEVRRRRVDEVLERVGLAAHGGRALRKCSKGMTQRVGLAQAILADPDLLILDEPMSGLDPIGRREVRDLILELRDEGKTVVFSSHILQDAEMICDAVAILEEGRLHSLGRLDEMISQSVRWFEVTVHGMEPSGLDADLVSRSGDESLVRVDDVEELTRLLGRVEGAGGQVVSVWPSKESLEDLFLDELRKGKGS